MSPATFHCLILENDPADQQQLRGRLDQVPHLNVVATVGLVSVALPLLRANVADVLLLNLELPDIQGLDLLRSLPQPPRTIVTSTSPNHAFDAYALGVVDYVLKPYPLDRLLLAINRATRQPNRVGPSVGPAETIMLSLPTRPDRASIALPTIRFAYSQPSGCVVVTDSAEIAVRESLGVVQARLPDSQFLRINKSCLVAREKISSHTNSTLMLGETELVIGPAYRRIVKERMKNC